MTTIFPYEIECSQCGKMSEQIGLSSSNQMGMPDLDTRPPEMLRSSLLFWVQNCPHCGYCAPNIDQEFPEAEKTTRSEAYRKLLQKRSLPENARYFLCWAMIQAAVGEDAGAGWSSLHAAWVCDDKDRLPAAKQCRLQALEHFLKARRDHGRLPEFDEPGAEEILLADLFRRTGQFERAEEISRTALAKKPGEVVQQALDYQIILAAGSDSACHSLEDIVG